MTAPAPLSRRNPRYTPLAYYVPFVVFAVISAAAIYTVLSKFGQPHVARSSWGDLASALVVFAPLVFAMWRRSTSPLRTPILILMLAEITHAAWTMSPAGPGVARIIGPFDVAVELAYAIALAVLCFDRPPLADPTATCSPSAAPNPGTGTIR